MKKLFPILLVAAAIYFFFIPSKKDAISYPKPLETLVSDYMKEHEGKHKGSREAWIEMMHGGEESNWREIEYNNAKLLLNEKLQRRREGYNRGDFETFAGGSVIGKWIERGSINQAGNVRISSFDDKNDMIYCIGGGGPMFRSDIYGSFWELINDDYRFDGTFLEVMYDEDDNMRLVTSQGSFPYYSDDEGATWNAGSGIGNNGGTIKKVVVKDSIIYALYKPGYWSNYGLFISKNRGENYVKKYSFSTNNNSWVNIVQEINGESIYIAEKSNNNRFKLYKWDDENEKIEVIDNDISLFLGEEGDMRGFNVVKTDTSTNIYQLNEEKSFSISTDFGQNWEELTKIVSNPWDVGVFVAPSNPNKMLYGEVDAFRSDTGGNNWNNINFWWEYYSDPINKLHADIMDIAEYTTSDGDDFILIGNHGGLNISTDYGNSNFNLGTFGLNVGQFYDVATDPNDPYYMYGGTQDQGLQRGEVELDELPSYLDQNISGDYGHLTFTSNGEHLWTVYPGGWIGIYTSPRTQSGPVASFEINSKKETVWIPPIMASANPAEDVIYAAGGSLDSESEGSYIIRAEYKDGIVETEELPFDFAQSGGTISAMAISPFDANIWYVLTTNGKYYLSEDGGVNFELKQQFLSGSHYLYGSCVLPSKLDPNVIYISGNGYSQAPVYKSDNGGFSFSAMENGMLPTMCFNIVANEDESLLFAATESGPYVFVTEKNEWFSLTGADTPNQTYWSVEYIDETKTARFGTYGRGIWDFSVSEITEVKDQNIAVSSIKIFPNPSSDIIQLSLDESFERIGNSTVNVINAAGIIVLSNSIIQTNNKFQLNISELKSGNYFLEIRNQKRRAISQFTKI